MSREALQLGPFARKAKIDAKKAKKAIQRSKAAQEKYVKLYNTVVKKESDDTPKVEQKQPLHKFDFGAQIQCAQSKSDNRVPEELSKFCEDMDNSYISSLSFRITFLYYVVQTTFQKMFHFGQCLLPYLPEERPELTVEAFYHKLAQVFQFCYLHYFTVSEQSIFDPKSLHEAFNVEHSIVVNCQHLMARLYGVTYTTASRWLSNNKNRPNEARAVLKRAPDFGTYRKLKDAMYNTVKELTVEKVSYYSCLHPLFLYISLAYHFVLPYIQLYSSWKQTN